MKVLLSIKPEFANRIFEGSKKYEYRKVIFKNPHVDKIVVYASSPVKKVIGEIEVGEVLKDSPESLWLRTKNYSGISEDVFNEYFEDKEVGFAIKVKSAKKYDEPLCIRENYGIRPPQSFQYVNTSRNEEVSVL